MNCHWLSRHDSSLSWQIFIIALEKRSWLLDAALRGIVTDVTDYVTAVKASDALTRLVQRLPLSGLRQMFTNSFHLGWCVVPRASLREPNGTNPRAARDMSRLVRHFNKNVSITFRRRNKCERSDACLSKHWTRDWEQSAKIIPRLQCKITDLANPALW